MVLTGNVPESAPVEIGAKGGRGRGESGRFAFIDGLRGLCALLIVVTHIFWEICPRGDGAGLPHRVADFFHPLAVSNKVPAFIVVSGFGLALASLRGTGGIPALYGGFRGFLQRRARRILPPYYAALALTIVFAAVLKHAGVRITPRWGTAQPETGYAHSLVSHLILVHNLHPDWNTQFDPPMWSLAVEWQMYFVFALLLLPLWRRFGLATAVSTALVLGYLPHFLLKPEWNYDWTCPWYAGLFSLGMAAAAVRASQGRRREAGAVALFTGMIAVILCWSRDGWFGSERRLVSDTITALFAAALLVFCRCCVTNRYPSAVVSFLQSPPLAFLGRISYSLYLVHFPLIGMLHIVIRHWFPNNPPGLTLQLATLYLLGLPLSLTSAYFFARLFEKPVQARVAA